MPNSAAHVAPSLEDLGVVGMSPTQPVLGLGLFVKLECDMKLSVLGAVITTGNRDAAKPLV